MLKWWQILLFPFAILYDLVTRFRNHLYNIESKKSFQFSVPVFSVGNLSVGGTGKTPMVAYLVDYLISKHKNIAILSRGYGRKTKGFRICNNKDSPETVGDEPFTYFLRYGSKVMITVGEDRALSIPFILAENDQIDVIVLDDAFQHRSVQPNFQIVLTTQNRPFWKDYLLPAGRLREARVGYKRADAVVVSKSTYQNELDWMELPYFNSKIIYKNPKLFFGTEVYKKVVLVAGLANNQLFFEYCNNLFEVVKTYGFSDHYHYQIKDIEEIIQSIESDVTLLTTEKDAVKIMQFSKQLSNISSAYIPIEISFLQNEERFLQMIDQSLINAE